MGEYHCTQKCQQLPKEPPMAHHPSGWEARPEYSMNSLTNTCISWLNYSVFVYVCWSWSINRAFPSYASVSLILLTFSAPTISSKSRVCFCFSAICLSWYVSSKWSNVFLFWINYFYYSQSYVFFLLLYKKQIHKDLQGYFPISFLLLLNSFPFLTASVASHLFFLPSLLTIHKSTYHYLFPSL